LFGQLSYLQRYPPAYVLTWHINNVWDPLNMTEKYLDSGCYLKLKDV
jgi:hypothetical protein